MKTHNFYAVLVMFTMMTCATQLTAQWDNPGDQQTSHGTSTTPRILGFGGANIELSESNQSAAGSPNGLIFSVQNNNGQSHIREAYLHYHTNNNQLIFSKTGQTSDSRFDVDADNGNIRTNGSLELLKNGVSNSGSVGLKFNNDDAIWYNNTYFSWGQEGNYNVFEKPISIGSTESPPSGTGLMMGKENNIKMLGENSYIQWHIDADPSNKPSGFVGSNPSGTVFVESNASQVKIDGETGLEFLVADTRRMVIDDSGNVGIGTSSPDYKLQVVGDVDISGQITGVSDARLKKNIETITSAIDKVGKLNPVSYKFRSSEYPKMKFPENNRMGFLAQEVEGIFPELVTTGGEVTHTDGNSFTSKSVNYIEIIPMLAKAIQEQQDIIDAQNNRFDAINTELTEIKNMLKAKK